MTGAYSERFPMSATSPHSNIGKAIVSVKAGLEKGVRRMKKIATKAMSIKQAHECSVEKEISKYSIDALRGKGNEDE